MGIATKWPRLVVVGDNVTADQADEILIRTNFWTSLFSNDKAWQSLVTTLMVEFGYPPALGHTPRPDVASIRARIEATSRWENDLGIINLGYLHNWQIMSAWIGGPHGWCDWDGNVGCSTFNIGKWPSSDEVTEDWQAIAAAFPYLRLTAQCIEDEGEDVVAGTWTVADGAATYEDGPADRITEPTEHPISAVYSVLNAHRERGVDYHRLRQAMERVANRA